MLYKICTFAWFINSAIIKTSSTSVNGSSTDQKNLNLIVLFKWIVECAKIPLNNWNAPFGLKQGLLALTVNLRTNKMSQHLIVPKIFIFWFSGGPLRVWNIKLLERKGKISLEREVKAKTKNFLDIISTCTFSIISKTCFVWVIKGEKGTNSTSATW